MFQDDKCFKLDYLDSFEEFYELADDKTRKEYDDNRGGTPDEVAYKMLKLIIKVANTDQATGKVWTPNWSDGNQRKWAPYFNLSSGFGFSGSDYGYDYANTGVCSRLCFETENNSNIIAKKFIHLYKSFLTCNN